MFVRVSPLCVNVLNVALCVLLVTVTAWSTSAETTRHSGLRVSKHNIQTARCQPGDSPGDDSSVSIDLRRETDNSSYLAKVSIRSPPTLKDFADRRHCIAQGRLDTDRGPPFLQVTCLQTFLFDLNAENLACYYSGKKSKENPKVSTLHATVFGCRVENGSHTESQNKDDSASSHSEKLVLDIHTETQGSLRFESHKLTSRELVLCDSAAEEKRPMLCRAEETSTSKTLMVVVPELKPNSPFTWSEASCSLQVDNSLQIIYTARPEDARPSDPVCKADNILPWSVAGVTGSLCFVIVIVLIIVYCFKSKKQSATKKMDGKMDTSENLMLNEIST